MKCPVVISEMCKQWQHNFYFQLKIKTPVQSLHTHDSMFFILTKFHACKHLPPGKTNEAIVKSSKHP
jgi:hypothetical protein